MPQMSVVRVPWPLRGISRNYGYQGQPAGTTPDALNVRAYDPATGRARGAQRCGLSRYLSAQLSAGDPIQCIDHATIAQGYSGVNAIGVRSIIPVAVSGGDVAQFSSTAFTVATAGANALSATAPVIHSAELFGTVYFADGVNHKLWDAASNTVSSWTASAGSFPVAGSDYPRLIAQWRTRIMLAGIKGDEHNYFASAAGGPTNFDYAPATITQTMAFAGNAGAGEIGDVINCLCPWTNEIFIFGCDHSIWVMHGDIAAGGTITQLSNITGMAFGTPYCLDPYGALWFFGSRGGVYRLASGDSIPERVTAQAIDEELAKIDLSKTLAKMCWNDREQTVHLFLTRLDEAECFHYALDTRNKGWWVDKYSSTDFNPVGLHVFDGDSPDDRVIMLGGLDSRIRYMDLAATRDDGVDIDSYCLLGPIKTGKPISQAILRELQGTLSSGSGDITYDVLSGHSAEEAALAATPVFSGTWSAGRNPSELRGARGDAILVKLRGAGDGWSLENVDAKVELLGSEAQRVVS